MSSRRSVGSVTETQRATIFGGEAERYDRFRPGYPAEIIDRVVELQPATAVDAGCGTGKAARLVASRGICVVGVEPDPRMAEIARRHGIDVTVSRLEDWDVVDCDVLYSAQAWHWIDPVRGAEIAGASIRPGGRWAAFWNDETDEVFGEARDRVYRRFAPELLDQRPSSDEDDLRAAIADGLRATNLFEKLVADEVAWVDHVDVEVAVERLASHSSHRLLERDLSASINEALRQELGAPTDVLDLSYTTRIFTADRR
jgi:SAM-dependent methyltransferase